MSGVMLLVLISVVWGGNMVSIKIGNQGISPMLAAVVRSLIASFLVLMYAKILGRRAFLAARDVKHGLILGTLFGLDFLFLYWGPVFTDASRAIIFLYTQPLWTAIGAHLFLPEDRLTLMKTGGICLSLAGMILVFGAESSTAGQLHWVGDLMEVVAAIFWAATTIYVKRFIAHRPVTHLQTLFAQLFFSVPALFIGCLIFEGLRAPNLTPPVLGALAYQTVVVAFASYLIWFWMIHRYHVSLLSSFTFLVPLAGVLMSGLFLGESLPPLLWAGLALTASGIYLVNRPQPSRPLPTED